MAGENDEQKPIIVGEKPFSNVRFFAFICRLCGNNDRLSRNSGNRFPDFLYYSCGKEGIG